LSTAIEYRQYIGSILNVFPMTTTTAYPTINAAGGQPGFPDLKIDQAVLYGAAEVTNLLVSNPTNPRRIGYLTAVAITSGLIMPTHIGPLGAITIDSKPGVCVAPDEAQRLITNTLGLTLNTGYYGIDGMDRIYFSGTACTADMVAPATLTLPDQVPNEYADVVVAIALEFLEVFQGEHTEAASHWRGVAQDGRQQLIGGIVPLTTPVWVGGASQGAGG